MTSSSSSSVKPHESTLRNNGHVLVGTGERLFKLGFVNINIYSLGFYVYPKGCCNCLGDEYNGCDYDGLLLNSSKFYNSLATSKFCKTFSLTFCRSISKEKLINGFDVPLRLRVESISKSKQSTTAEQQQNTTDVAEGEEDSCNNNNDLEKDMNDAEILLSNLVPESGVNDNDILKLICYGDGKTIKAIYKSATTSTASSTNNNNGNGGDDDDDDQYKLLIQIESSTNWLALQSIYFDDNTPVPTIRHSMIANLPDILKLTTTVVPTLLENETKIQGGNETTSTTSSRSSSNNNNNTQQQQPTEEEIDKAVGEELAKSANNSSSAATTTTTSKYYFSKDWKEFAGRTKGGSSYKFGDLTLGVMTAMGVRSKKKPSSSEEADGEVESNNSRSLPTLVDEKDDIIDKLNKANMELQEKVNELCMANHDNISKLKKTQDLLTYEEQALPIRIIFAIIFVELLQLGIGRLLFYNNISSSSLHNGRLSIGIKIVIIIIFGGIISFLQQQRQQQQQKKKKKS